MMSSGKFCLYTSKINLRSSFLGTNTWDGNDLNPSRVQDINSLAYNQITFAPSTLDTHA